MNLFTIAGLACGISCTILALIALIFGKLRIHRILAFFNISVAIWGFGGFLVGRATTETAALFAWKFAHVGGIFVGVFFYHMVCIFCELKRGKSITLAYIVGLFFLWFNVFTAHLINRTRFVFDSLYYNDVTVFFYILAVLWFFLVILSFFELTRFLPKAKGNKHTQALYIIFGFLTGFLGGTSTFLPEFRIDILYPFGNFGIVIYCLIVTYAIIKYRLLDIRVAITSWVIFGVVYTLVLGIPFGLAGWGRTWLISIFGPIGSWIPMLILLLFATIGPYIFIYLQHRALDRVLFEERHAHNLLLKASQGMAQVRNLKKLLGLIVHFISRTLKTVNAQVFLSEPDSNKYSLKTSRFSGRNIFDLSADEPLIQYLQNRKEPLVYEELRLHYPDKPTSILEQNYKNIEFQMRDLNSAVIIPCLIEDTLLGFLSLGEKRSKRMYTQDDLNVLSTLANQAALAIENAQFFDEVQRTQEQLFQAEKMATVGTMADGLSHQINNRFNALGLIAGDTIDTLKMTRKEQLSPKIKETLDQIEHALEKVEDNVKKGGEVVKGLLKYSRPGQAGFEEISLDTIVDASLEMAQYKVKLNEIEIKRSYNKNLPKIKANLTQLQEVFFNLIDNAYFATKQRKEELKEENYKGIIDISAQQMNSKLQIKVSDNGIGVKKEDFDKLFTPFFTTKASSKMGTGLGLFVIQKIITNNHKGKISVESIYKQGTTFIIELSIIK